MTALAVLLLPLLAAAQLPEPGVIVGRISNPATGELVRDAQVRIDGTNQLSISGDGGFYRLADVQPGLVTVTVVYTGYQTITESVQVSAGQTTTRDFELRSALARQPAGDGTVQLEAVQVSSEREGNAKAIMQQRNSMNITNSVATDVFGEIAEGNIAEFLKHLPGVEIVQLDGNIRNVRLRGLGAEYTGVTVDGVGVAAADANTGSAGDARALSFEQVSLTSIESIEISKTISADVDASAPAGTINLKTKRAFDRKGRRISWQTNLSAFSEEFSFSRAFSPDEVRKRRILPGGSLEYSDVFLNSRLGLVINLSQANNFSMITQNSTTYNFAATAADPRPAVITAMTLNRGSRLYDRFSATVTADFKATPQLIFSLGLMYNYFDQWSPRSNVTFNTGARGTVVGNDPLLSFTTTASNASIVGNSQGISKLSETFTFMPRFEYTRGDLKIEGRFSGSISESSYDPFYGNGGIGNFGNPTLSGVTYQATRTSLTRADWQISQIGGTDWSTGAGYTSPILTLDDGRYALSQVYSGELIGTLKTRKRLLIVWKAGIKTKREIRDFNVDTELSRYTYVGPGSGVGSWASYRSPYVPSYEEINSSVRSLSGGSVFAPHLLGVGQLFRDHPEYFSHSLTAANFYNATINARKYYVEDITAAFLMATSAIGRTQFRAGLRWEDTAGKSREFDPRTPAEVVAAGFPETAGRATTIPGLEYQYFSKPKVYRRGGYDDLFATASVKHELRNNLSAHLGFSQTIRRPSFRDISGVWSINDDTLRVSAPNPNLTPEHSDNLSARLAYYFEPVGIAAVSVFQNTVSGLFRSGEMTAREFGNTDPALDAYTFIATVQSEDKTVVRGWELEYSQSLSFLPKPFNGLNIRGSYTRTYSEVITPQMSPHIAAGGLSYSARGLNLSANLTWRDDSPLDIQGWTYLRHRTSLDAAGSYRLSNRISFFFTVKNLLNAPEIVMTRQVIPATSTAYRVWGAEWSFGLKGTF